MQLLSNSLHRGVFWVKNPKNDKKSSKFAFFRFVLELWPLYQSIALDVVCSLSILTKSTHFLRFRALGAFSESIHWINHCTQYSLFSGISNSYRFFSVMEAFFQKCASTLQSRSVRHANGQCITWTGSFSKSNGYGQFRFRDPRDPRGGHRTKTAHRVALMVERKDFDVPSSQHASHLCNNRLCINANHLVFEGSGNNNLRKSCFLNCRCNGHFSEDGERLPDCLVELQARNWLAEKLWKLHCIEHCIRNRILLILNLFFICLNRWRGTAFKDGELHRWRLISFPLTPGTK